MLDLRSIVMRLAWLTLIVAALAPGCTEGRRRPGGDGGTGDGAIGDGDGGTRPFACFPGRQGCFGTTRFTCADDGVTRLDEVMCPSECDANLGCVFCRPGTRRCEGTVSQFCAPDGMSWVSGRDCSEWSSTCGSDGFCADTCADAERTRSNVGCEYWPVPLANAEIDSTIFDFRVVVANPNELPANVRIRRGDTEVWSGTLAPGALEAVVLPWIDGQSFGIPEGSWSSLIVQGAYRLTSDVPVIVTQFNPFEYAVGETYSYTNDASLLLPSHALTGQYVAASYLPLSRSFGTSDPLGGTTLDPLRYPGYVAIVGTSAEPTRVTISSTSDIAAGAGGRIAATSRGRSLTFTLARGEVAHVVAAVPPECSASRPGYLASRSCMGSVFGEICDIRDTCSEPTFDLTGSRIVADHPVAVFGGHTCAYVPFNAEACDHLEEQLPPVETWGRDYVGAPMGDGSIAGTNIVRVIGAFAGTTVTVDPPQGGVSGGALGPGELLEFQATSPFRVTATQSVMVTQYLRGQYSTDPPATRGDPSLLVLVPAEQYRMDYTFILPTSYNASTNGQNHVLVVRPPGLAITLDGAPITASFSPIGDREIGVVRLDGGTHRMEAAQPFGLVAYGMGSFTSYATPAGLNLEPITVVF